MASFAQPSAARATPKSSPLRRHTDHYTARASSSRPKLLPEGSCNYKNLRAGGDQPTCGCRRFWENGTANSCVCGHHACFHDELELPRSSVYPQELTPFDGRPGTGRSSQVPTAAGLPPIPDICLLSGERDGRKTRHDHTTRPTGLGLTVQPSSGASRRHPSPSPTEADPIDFNALHYVDPDIPSTRHSSAMEDERTNISPDPAFIESVLQNRAIIGPPLDVVQSSDGNIAVEDFVTSPTEVATPSVAATPDFKALDQLVHDTKGLADVLSRLRDTIGNAAGPSREASVSAMPSQLDGSRSKRASPTNRTSPYRQALTKLPSTVHQILPQLTSLSSQLASLSNLTASINNLTGRLSALERASFDYVSPADFDHRIEPLDTRMFDAEERLDGHTKRLDALEVEVNGSNHGLLASTGGSFISTRLSDAESRLRELEGRLNDVYAASLPSGDNPWRVEVVLLPWGRDLKGIWVREEELDRPGSKATTQRSEEWADTRGLRASSSSFHSFGETAWSKDAIHQWMDEADEWLYPKACGPNNLVYQRLKSRGFVQDVNVAGAESSAVRVAICQAFHGVLRAVSSSQPSSKPESNAYEAEHRQFLGLTSPFIPLRKVHKSSKLRFLAPSEMVSPALWTATFLASSVLMKAAAGHKRLYITTREGYLQHSESKCPSWTWKKLRDLAALAERKETPSVSHIPPEGEVEDDCWAHRPELDAPSSAYSSFHFQPSGDAARAHPTVSAQQPGQALVSDNDLQAVRSDSGTHPLQPITPTSELPPTKSRPYHLRHRTVSVPLSDAPSQLREEVQQAKRRVRSFEQTNNPLIDKIPSYVPSTSKTKPRREKRRRITRSRSASNKDDRSLEEGGDDAIIDQHIAYLETGDDRALQGFALTPRRSRDSASLQLPAPSDGDGASAYRGSDETGSNMRASQTFAAVHAHQRQAIGRTADSHPAKRGSTPGVYMTPFSGNFVPHGPSSAGLRSDVHDDGEEEAWNGIDGDEHGTAIGNGRDGHENEEKKGGQGEEEYDSMLDVDEDEDDHSSDMDYEE